LTEHAKLRFEGQFFNVFNHPNFGLPSMVLAGIPGKPSTQTGFGALTYTTAPPTGLLGVGLGEAGAAGPINENPYQPTQKAELFYPRQVIMDLSLTALLIAGLGLLSFMIPVKLGPAANPADAQYVPRPEWYYLPIFQWLKYWHGSAAIVGVLVIPALLVLTVLALPFLDRTVERRPWKRPAAMAVCILGVLNSRARPAEPVFGSS
jgi:quinol-cytochrome oxidoreductase complex cytochrome b subunit